jgi:hypothetical protein
MASTPLPAAVRTDKALVRQIAEFDDRIENAEEFVELMRSDASKAPIRKEVAPLRKRMKAALEGADKQERAKTVAALVKDATKLADAASLAFGKDLHERYMTRWTQARGLLAQALVEVGAIEPPALRLPVQKEQADLKAQLDRIEHVRDADPGNIQVLDKLIAAIEALLKRLGGVKSAGDWMRSTYLPLAARVQAALKRVPAERCRKTLLAEIDFIEVDVNKALLKGDTKAVQARALPQLQSLERVASRAIALSPSLDRELARLGKLVQGRADAAEAIKRLKALVQLKASAWPEGATVDDIERSLARFEADVAKLAAQLDKAPAAAAAKA